MTISERIANVVLISFVALGAIAMSLIAYYAWFDPRIPFPFKVFGVIAALWGWGMECFAVVVTRTAP